MLSLWIVFKCHWEFQWSFSNFLKIAYPWTCWAPLKLNVMSQTTFHTVNDTRRVRSTHRQVVSLEELNFSVHETYYSYILQIIFQALFIVHCKCECVCEKEIEDVCVCVCVCCARASIPGHACVWCICEGWWVEVRE